MVKWNSKGCPRCGGTTYVERNGDEAYQVCLMCSNRVDISVPRKVKAAVTEEKATLKS